MYNVVFRGILDENKGTISWTSFRNKKHFTKWYDAKMQSWYQIVDKNVSKEQAIEYCSTPTAFTAAVRNQILVMQKRLAAMKEFQKFLENF